MYILDIKPSIISCHISRSAQQFKNTEGPAPMMQAKKKKNVKYDPQRRDTYDANANETKQKNTIIRYYKTPRT